MAPKSAVWLFSDFIRHLLIVAGTIAVLYFLWKIHWLLAPLAALPVYILMVNLVGFITLPLYILTPEHAVAAKAYKAIEKGNPAAAFDMLKAYQQGKPIPEDLTENEFDWGDESSKDPDQAGISQLDRR